MIKFGADVLIEQNPDWKTRRIALVTNTAATTNLYQPTAAALLKKGFNLIRLFSPEHGFNAKGADGAKMQNSIDPLTRLPVISLYGDHLAPRANDLEDIDLILFDIPDVGVRFYTYLWTLTYVLQASAAYNKPLIVLDRPNPISGNIQLCEGPMLDEQHCSSFIGRWNIPLRHSCTLGELALFFNTTKDIRASLQVIACQNWKRNEFQPNWGINFIPTSPAIRNFNAAMLYPGLGLLEATNISEGRGSHSPFELVLAPWIDNTEFLRKELSGDVALEKIRLIPDEGKYAGLQCKGIHIKLQKYKRFKSVQNGLMLLKLIKDQYPEHFSWNPYPTNVNPEGTGHLSKLLGLPQSEAMFELPMAQFKNMISEACRLIHWKKEISPFLIYV